MLVDTDERWLRGRGDERVVELEEALKHKTTDWRIIENLMTISLIQENLFGTIRYMDTLLDLGSKSGRPLHLSELRRLVQLVLWEHLQVIEQQNTEESETEKRHHRLLASLSKLLNKITEAMKVDNELWEVIALYYEKLNDNEEHIKSRFKQFRSLLVSTEWEKNSDTLELLSNCAEKLMQSKGLTSSDLYAAKSLFVSAYEKAKSYYLDSYEEIPSLTKLKNLASE